MRTLLRRELSPALQYFRGVEVQARGALHDHAMVWSPVPLDRNRVARLAIRAGFGHSVDLAPAPPGSKRAAYYVSKYVTKATDCRAAVPWLLRLVDVETGEVTDEVGEGRYRTWSMSREWGLTMAAVRAENRAFVLARQASEWDELRSLLVSELGAVVLPDESPPPPS